MIEQRKKVVMDKWRRRVQEEKIQKWATWIIFNLN